MGIDGLYANIIIKMEGSNTKSCMKFSVEKVVFDWNKLLF